MSRSALATILMCTYLGLVFIWRSWVQWRRTGSTGFIRPRRGAPALELIGSIGFVVSLVLLIATPIGDLVGIERLAVLDGTWSLMVGVALCLSGTAFTLIAQLSMGDSWRIGVDDSAMTDLVTTGVFTHMRNPIFTSMIIATVGFVLVVPSPVSIAALAFLVFALQVQTRFVEEPYLLTTHGQDYEDYVARTGRFFPRTTAPG